MILPFTSVHCCLFISCLIFLFLACLDLMKGATVHPKRSQKTVSFTSVFRKPFFNKLCHGCIPHALHQAAKSYTQRSLKLFKLFETLKDGRWKSKPDVSACCRLLSRTCAVPGRRYSIHSICQWQWILIRDSLCS